MGYGGSGYRIWDPTKKQVVVSNHVKVHENELGSDWLKQLASQSNISRLSLPPPPGNHGSTNDDDDSVLLGDTIVVAPPIKQPEPGQQIPAKAEAITIATAATEAANDSAGDDLDH